MNRRIYIGMVALPIYLYNADVNLISHSEASSFTNQLFAINVVIDQKANNQSQVRSWQIADGRDQTEDCLRRRDCKI
ncbi:hypothetical protein H6G36_10140 [Anabaena minutissima FACHB-250]|nr:hypothetical protein [Anabaena minutissima FACHB-250]